jgi:hypothetical protein
MVFTLLAFYTRLSKTSLCRKAKKMWGQRCYPNIYQVIFGHDISSFASAAVLPAPARMTVAAPVTASPPAKTRLLWLRVILRNQAAVFVRFDPVVVERMSGLGLVDRHDDRINRQHKVASSTQSGDGVRTVGSPSCISDTFHAADSAVYPR